MLVTLDSGVQIACETVGRPMAVGTPVVFWAHGWGQSRRAFASFAESFAAQATHVLIDFPGFGESPLPPAPWTVQDYADAAAKLIMQMAGAQPVIWCGHSFGGRVGLRLAASHPELVKGLFLVASHGLKPKRGLLAQLRIRLRVMMFKTLKLFAPLTGQNLDALRSRFGSADYKNAGAMRPTFVKVIADDVADVLPGIACPTQLVYGENDMETPVGLGLRLQALIKGAEILILPGQDHYSVIGEGRHPVLKSFKQFMERVQ